MQYKIHLIFLRSFESELQKNDLFFRDGIKWTIDLEDLQVYIQLFVYAEVRMIIE